MALFRPDRYFSRISAIDVGRDLVNAGFRAVLLDVDNTVLSRIDNTAPADVIRWLNKLEHAGIKACLLSNNFHDYVLEAARELDLPIVAKAMKPLPHGYAMACHKLNVKFKETVMIGDQISTDILGAHIVGMAGYLVCPLVEQDLKHTIFIRNLERSVIADQEPEGVPACETLPS